MPQRQCPLCGTYTDHFLTAGVNGRPEAMCSSCGSMERHRLLGLYLIHQKKIFDTDIRLLHFAPEKIFHTIFSKTPNVDYWAVDYSPENFNFESGEPILRTDITDIPFKDNWFDVILCNHVLEHIPDDSKAMNELYRTLKPGGWAILQVPLDTNRNVTYEDWSITSPQERAIHFGQDDHVRMYGNDYKDRLEKAGFTVTVDRFVEALSEEQQIQFGVMPQEHIYFCEKK